MNQKHVNRRRFFQLLTVSGITGAAVVSEETARVQAAEKASQLPQKSVNSSLPQNQSNWRWCNKCQCLFYAGFGLGVCAAGGTHSPSGSGNYVLSSHQ